MIQEDDKTVVYQCGGYDLKEYRPEAPKLKLLRHLYHSKRRLTEALPKRD